jgi:hypothetical protein
MFSFRPFRFRLLVCTVVTAALCSGGFASEPSPTSRPSGQSLADGLPDGAAAKLAAEVGAIAESSGSTRAKKEKLISAAVREAVISSVSGLKGASAILKAALALTTAATESAPAFADVIARSATFSGPVTGIDGAGAKIRAAAFAAAGSASGGKSSGRSSATGGDAARAARDLGYGGADVRFINNPGGNPATGDATPSPRSVSGEPKISLGKNSSVAFTAQLSVSRDSNLYLQSKDEVAETIATLRPGVEFNFGQKSLAHGSIAYGMAFTRYADTGSNSRLGNASADFGYSGSRINLDAKLSFGQTEQGTRDLASVSGQSLLRRTTGTYSATAETQLTAKTSFETGANGSWTRYKKTGLIGDNNITLPLKVYVNLTPKLAVSTGFSHDQTTPQGNGPTGRGNFYNVGLRGNLTEKLSSNFSIGYRTRAVGDAPDESSLGFDGSFGLQATAKTSLNLALSRNFSTSPAGESLKNTGLSLSLSSAPSLTWQFATGLSYRKVDYGPRVFADVPVFTPNDRADRFLQFNLSATYLFNSWMNATAAWALSQNRSNVADSDFSGSILTVSLGFRY